MTEPRVINCEKRSGELVCSFYDKKTGMIRVHGSVNEKGEAVITKSLADNKEGTDPDAIIKAQKFTLNQIRLKRVEEGEF